MVAISVLLTFWALTIAASDFLRLKVPNLLLAVVALPAVAVQVFYGRGLLDVSNASALIGFGIGVLFLSVGYVMSQVGAADVKYAALLGFLVGVPRILEVLLASALVIGLLSLATLLLGRWRRTAVGKVPAALAMSAAFLLHLAGR